MQLNGPHKHTLTCLFSYRFYFLADSRVNWGYLQAHCIGGFLFGVLMTSLMRLRPSGVVKTVAER